MKNLMNFETFSLNEEKKTKKQGSETLGADSYAYTPNKNKSSTWKLRIDDRRHVGGAVAALGKGYRGHKVSIPSDDVSKVKARVRRAYRKFNPDKEIPSAIE